MNVDDIDNPDQDDLNAIFRAAHSIKGGSSFFGLTKVKELAHKAETVLDMLRSRKMAANAEVTNVLLAAFDKLPPAGEDLGGRGAAFERLRQRKGLGQRGPILEHERHG